MGTGTGLFVSIVIYYVAIYLTNYMAIRLLSYTFDKKFGLTESLITAFLVTFLEFSIMFLIVEKHI